MSSTYERNRMIAQLKLLEAGVVPVDRGFLASIAKGPARPLKVVRDSLSSLSPEERRKSTRKFRKLHRKVAKELMKKANRVEKARARGMQEFLAASEKGPSRPTPKCHDARNREVWQYFMHLAATGKI
jgi:hypothetical protein